MSKRTDRLREENNQREQQLQDQENQAVLTDMVVYIRSANISPYEQELVRRDIGSMLLEGERRGERAQDIIGEDYRAFCDRVIGEIPKVRGGKYILSLVRDVLLAADVLVVIWLGFSLFTAVIQGPFTLWLPVKLGQLLGGALIIAFSYGLVEYVCRTSFEDRSPTKVQVIGIFVGMVLFFLICMLLRQTLFSLHAGIAAVLAVVLYLIYKVTDRMES